MLALLKLIPIKDYIYGAIIAALLVFIGICKHDHTVVKEVKQIGTAAQAVVKTDDATAEKTETQSALIYKQAIVIPAVGDVGIECVREHPGSSALPAPIAGTGAATNQPAADSGSGPQYDPSGAALTRARAADAQIAYLQRRVKELEAQMNAAP
jgi:hypothetical protein